MALTIRAETLIEKLQHLPASKLAEVEDFVDALRNREPSASAQEERSCLAAEAGQMAPSASGHRCSSANDTPSV
jgi:hypothetical protein